jgi:hypothetical protein
MKHKLLLIFLLSTVVSLVQGQSKNQNEEVTITSNKDKTAITLTENGGLFLNVSLKDIEKFKMNGFVNYEDFGAIGDGKTDDIYAIAATHAFANQNGLSVKVKENAKYYIGGKNRTAIIQTNTNFGNANFIIDDTEVQNRTTPVFKVASSLKSYKLKGITSLKKDQEKIPVTLPSKCLITATDINVKRYIRAGGNQNEGSAQTDIFLADENGNVDKNAPIIWDFNFISDITALPIDETTLTITGGNFTTIANREESKYNYYTRGISIKRSNVVLGDLHHNITGEGESGAPYSGFINVSDCAFVTIKNSVLTGRKVYQTIGKGGTTVSMGSYGILVNKALNVSLINCKQTNDINDKRYWGLFASNFSKNLLYDGCEFSRFDAHMGVSNATIRNSILGHQGINAIGSGTFLVENTIVYSSNLINLRSDYGSTWEGEFIIRNCTFIPLNGNVDADKSSLIGGSNSGQHDFGYTCYMPKKISIENLKIDDSNHSKDYKGLAIFANFNPKMVDNSYQEKFPYNKTKEVFLKNVTTTSGKKLIVSNNAFLFKDVKVITE